MNILSPDKVIAALEDNAIKPFMNLKPTLGIIVRADAAIDEISYLRSLTQKAKEYNAYIQTITVKNAIEASKAILTLKSSPIVQGIINLSHFDNADRGLNDMIPQRLDLDCASSTTLGMLMANTSPVGYRLAPCAAVAAIKYLEYENIDLIGKKIAVLGRSLRVGRPLAEILCQFNGTATVFHSKSGEINLSGYDIVVAAMGRAEIVDKSWWKNGIDTQYLIDVGINTNTQNKLCGDVKISDFEDVDINITPVPRGIGKIATTVLFSKLYVNAAILSGDLIE